jgi:hypothetical protein
MIILLHLPSVKRFVKTSIQPSNIPQIKSMVNILKTKKRRLIDNGSIDENLKLLIITRTISKPDTISQGQAGEGKYFIKVFLDFSQKYWECHIYTVAFYTPNITLNKSATIKNAIAKPARIKTRENSIEAINQP